MYINKTGSKSCQPRLKSGQTVHNVEPGLKSGQTVHNVEPGLLSGFCLN